jgi:hypothetical protein
MEGIFSSISIEKVRFFLMATCEKTLKISFRKELKSNPLR